MPELLLPMDVHGDPVEVRFDNFPIESHRVNYDIELLLGRDEHGVLTRTPRMPELGTIEDALLEFVKSGDAKSLEEHNLKIVESPGSSEISRNITLLDVSNYTMYVIGGVGLVRFDADRSLLTLNDPLLNEEYGSYQSRHNRNPGGVVYVSEKGVSAEDNATPLGVSYAVDGPYSLLKKVEKTELVKEHGLLTPDYLFVGRITNLGKGEWGFSIYKTPVQPDYLRNLRLYLDSSANLKPVFLEYLDCKYAALRSLHNELGYSHGQPTVENAGGVIISDDKQFGRGACILKDMDTLKVLPKSTEKKIVEGPCPERVGINIKKSPHVAAQTYDLQLAVTQELNIILIASQQLPSVDLKFQFLKYQLSVMFESICNAYGINAPGQSVHILNFCLKHFINAVNKGLEFEAFTTVIGGLFANAVFGFSEQYKDQIEVIPE